MARGKGGEEIPQGQEFLFGGPEKSGPPPYSVAPFLPECTVRTTFGELQQKDVTDYWGDILYVVFLVISTDGRTVIRVRNGNKFQGAMAPSDEVVWRMPRAGE